MTLRKQLLITTTALALAPFAAQAAPISWTSGAMTNAWATGGNWTPAGPPATTSAVTVGVATNNPVQITTAVNLSGVGGSLTINSGDSVNIGTGGSLTMGTKTITLAGGTLSASGTGTLSSSGTIQGFGTFSSPDTGSTNFNANSASGPLTLTGGFSLSGTLTTSSAGGGINLTGDTFSGSTAGSGGAVNLNGATLKNVTLNNSGGQQLNVTGDSTLTGTISWFQLDTFNIGGSNGAHTLNLNAATLSTTSGTPGPFTIGAGGTLNNQTGTSSMGGGGTVTLNGGTISSTAGLFTVGDPISGNGTISGPVALAAGNETVSGGTLTLNGVTIGTSSSGPGISVGSGNTLDLKGNISAYSFNVNPGTGGLVQFDGATISKASTTLNTNINNSGIGTTGAFNVVGPNPSTLNNVNFSTGNGANLTVGAPLTVTGGATVNATNATVSSTGTLNLLNTTGTTDLTTKNLTLANGATLNVGAAGHNAITLSGNFSFLQTNTLTGWSNNGTPGLGPDLIMTGGNKATPLTLEAGSVNEGNIPAAYVDNFALDSLSLLSGAYVQVLDANGNATPSGWHSGLEVLYLEALDGVTPGGSNVIPTLDLNNHFGYVLGGTGYLVNGLYTDSQGREVNIINAAPEPATLALFGTGLLGLGLMRRRRRT